MSSWTHLTQLITLYHCLNHLFIIWLYILSYSTVFKARYFYIYGHWHHDISFFQWSSILRGRPEETSQSEHIGKSLANILLIWSIIWPLYVTDSIMLASYTLPYNPKFQFSTNCVICKSGLIMSSEKQHLTLLLLSDAYTQYQSNQ